MSLFNYVSLFVSILFAILFLVAKSQVLKDMPHAEYPPTLILYLSKHTRDSWVFTLNNLVYYSLVERIWIYSDSRSSVSPDWGQKTTITDSLFRIYQFDCGNWHPCCLSSSCQDINLPPFLFLTFKNCLPWSAMIFDWGVKCTPFLACLSTLCGFSGSIGAWDLCLLTPLMCKH